MCRSVVSSQTFTYYVESLLKRRVHSFSPPTTPPHETGNTKWRRKSVAIFLEFHSMFIFRDSCKNQLPTGILVKPTGSLPARWQLTQITKYTQDSEDRRTDLGTMLFLSTEAKKIIHIFFHRQKLDRSKTKTKL